MKKLKTILLVDDSESSNFYNKKLIEKIDAADNVYSAENGKEALDFINKKHPYECNVPDPNLILLDLNMPKMNGYEFLDELDKLPKSYTQKIMIVILTTSDWGKDKEQVKKYCHLVQGLIQKPLYKEKLLCIMDAYYEKNLKQ